MIKINNEELTNVDIFIRRNKNRMDRETLIGVLADKFDIDYFEAEEIVMKKLKNESMGFIKRSGTFKQVDDEGRLWEEIEFNGYPYMISKVDNSHFSLIPKDAFEKRGFFSRPNDYHVSEFNHMPEFYTELIKWLKGGEMIGGKSFDESVENKEKENIIEIKEEITIGDYILEKGDKIKIITEDK